jgi:ABC-type bacteriocin/lantibiotic exporter with double-glycine peptidase domain
LSVAAVGATVACASGYTGSARKTSPQTVTLLRGWLVVDDVPLVRQEREADCGAAAIAMVVAYWTGVEVAAVLEALGPVPSRGLKAGRLRDFARSHGLAAYLVKGELADLERELADGRPVLVGLAKPQRKGVLSHYEVVVGLHREQARVATLDPAEGWRENSLEGFLAEWKPTGQLTLVVSTTRSD